MPNPIRISIPYYIYYQAHDMVKNQFYLIRIQIFFIRTVANPDPRYKIVKLVLKRQKCRFINISNGNFPIFSLDSDQGAAVNNDPDSPDGSLE